MDYTPQCRANVHTNQDMHRFSAGHTMSPSPPSAGELPTHPLRLGSTAILSNDLAVRAILQHFGQSSFYNEDTFIRKARAAHCLMMADEKLAEEWEVYTGISDPKREKMGASYGRKRLQDYECVITWAGAGNNGMGCFVVEIVDDDGERAPLPFGGMKVRDLHRPLEWERMRSDMSREIVVEMLGGVGIDGENEKGKDSGKERWRKWDTDLEKGLGGLEGLCLGSQDYGTLRGLSNSMSQTEEAILQEQTREGRGSWIFNVAILAAFAMVCVLNVLVAMYAAVHGWDMSRVALYMVVANPMVVWLTWKVCEMVETCWGKRSVRLE